jgi:hypothetical protein
VVSAPSAVLDTSSPLATTVSFFGADTWNVKNALSSGWSSHGKTRCAALA